MRPLARAMCHLRCPFVRDRGISVKKTPLQIVRERFKSKDKLVEAVSKLATAELWLDRTGDSGLERVSNAKLLRLHAVLEDAKARFGSRDKLIETIQKLEKRVKDDGFKARLSQYSLPRLLDHHDAAARRAARADKQLQPATKAPKRARSKKAKAKAKAA